jgi:putative ATPase
MIPLAERVRPKNLDEFIGQEHLLGKDKALRKLLDQKKVFSMILWGPPGSGKTTLAKLIAEIVQADFFQISAVSSGVKELREIIQSAEQNFKRNKYTILFIDEIHRFNKAQQDALLHSIEIGLIILIGATTENPSFEIIPPLLSRCRVYVLKQHSIDDLKKILRLAISKDEYLCNLSFKFIDEDFLAQNSNGDARILLNTFEIAVELVKTKGDKLKINKEIIQEALQRKKIDYDKLGDEHYNLISAFIKSIRGSDPDAAVYYLARMLEGGEDPLFIARRMIILAAEDIGNASPNALVLATNTFQACHFIGMPEAKIILSQCATYLASQPKSNASYLAIEKAIEDVKNLPNYPVPLQLRNPVTKLMKELDYGKGYKYAHDYDEHFIQENYLPYELKDKQYYFPTESGQEKILKERLKNWWKGKKKY